MVLVEDSQGRRAVPCIIDGQPLPLDETRLEPVVSAASGQIIHYYQNVDVQSCALACDAAWAAFKSWKHSTVAKRREVLTNFSAALGKRTPEIFAAMKAEISCDDSLIYLNIGLATETAAGIAAAISEIRGVIPAEDRPGSTTFVFKEAIGPILVITPWNVPIFLAVRAVVGAIGAGCTVVLKASEMCPLTVQIVIEALAEAGLPKGVVNFITAARGYAAVVTEALIANKHIRKIDFIGSARVGRLVAATAAKYMKPTIMELGGKNSFIVLDDADLDKAAVMAAQSIAMCHGQFCVSADRIIVQRSVSGPFIEKLVAQLKTVQPGLAVSERVAVHAYELVRAAKEGGVKFLYGDAEFSSTVSATVALLQIDPKANQFVGRILEEETFGPSAVLYVVDDDDEAIELANNTEYGLIAAVHTKDMARGLKVGRALECGQVILNSLTLDLSVQVPFGATKGSGYGKTHGVWSLENFYVDRTIVWN